MGLLLTENHLGETCVVCEQTKYKGIHLYTSFICLDCEKELITTDTSNPKYKYFLNQLRKINTPEIYS
ncbi:sigma factor G inhibitor Gin [Cytobacillus spongiae]|uniref:sigma factor G inhibitor Gin n=1 Tax=Cytobacillus spongiae TaxID=2901381 RepID=UPI001F2435F7|nr:sigma factor G inhibitor Gin [Cytobacillus spongiae]UII55987.1 sigma factor G inhibitor Gin [Cytobacillus spongiae]